MKKKEKYRTLSSYEILCTGKNAELYDRYVKRVEPKCAKIMAECIKRKTFHGRIQYLKKQARISVKNRSKGERYVVRQWKIVHPHLKRFFVDHNIWLRINTYQDLIGYNVVNKRNAFEYDKRMKEMYEKRNEIYKP